MINYCQIKKILRVLTRYVWFSEYTFENPPIPQFLTVPETFGPGHEFILYGRFETFYFVLPRITFFDSDNVVVFQLEINPTLNKMYLTNSMIVSGRAFFRYRALFVSRF